jgi:nicotinamidase-related amidase
MMWPPHCVQGTPGAEFHPDLERSAADIVIHKGTNSRVDSYSGFGDAQGHKFEKTELQKVLQERDISDLFIVGLALDFCVAYTCKDAAICGFNVFCVKEACRGIQPTSIEEELAAMSKQNVHLLEHTDDVPTHDIEAAAKRGIIGGAIAHVPPAPAGGTLAVSVGTLKF